MNHHSHNIWRVEADYGQHQEPNPIHYTYIGCMFFGIHAFGVKIHHGYSSYLGHPHARMCHVHTKNLRWDALFTVGRGYTCPLQLKAALCDIICVWYILSVLCACRIRCILDIHRILIMCKLMCAMEILQRHFQIHGIWSQTAIYAHYNESTI